MIRLLVAEDSQTTRELLLEVFRTDPGIEIVGAARDGEEAVEMTRRLRPDIITMDVCMPKIDGFEATRRIMADAPTPIVIVSGSVDVGEVTVSMSALRAGALAVVQKLGGPAEPGFEQACSRLLSVVRSMSEVKVVKQWRRVGPTRAQAGVPEPALMPRGRILAIAASTGGPSALATLLGDLPREIPVPILVVQHIAAGFVAGMAGWLETVSGFPVVVPRDGARLRAGTVYIAPDCAHLGVSAPHTALVSKSAPIGGFRPSATFLFRSVSRVFGRDTVAVILTGMGQDGVDGLREIREAGGWIVAQDESSSVVYGMPGAAVAAGLPDAIVALDRIGAHAGRMIR